jgi:uncharacterized protein YjiS (DUF1127 family)
MLKHQFFPLPPSVAHREGPLPALLDRLPTSRIVKRDGCGFLPERSRQIPEPSEAVAKSLPETGRAMGRADAPWQSVLWFFLEGFALYGASVHWVATTAVTAIATEVDAQQRHSSGRSKQQKSISLVSPAACAETSILGREGATDRTALETRMLSTRDGLASPARGVDRYRSVHPGWPAIIWRAIASRWAKWRREREINKAVAALAECDDRELRDMGIPHRSQNRPCDMAGITDPAIGKVVDVAHALQGCVHVSFTSCKQSLCARARAGAKSERSMIALTRNRQACQAVVLRLI